MPARKRSRENAAGSQSSTAVHEPDVWTVDGRAGAEQLAEAVYDAERERPLVVASVAGDTGEPRLPVADLAEQVADLARVAVLSDMATSRAFSDLVPHGHQVYGGAVRVYWPRASREDATYRHDLVVIMDPASGPGAVADVHRLVERFHAGALHRPSGPAAARAPAPTQGQSRPALGRASTPGNRPVPTPAVFAKRSDYEPPDAGVAQANERAGDAVDSGMQVYPDESGTETPEQPVDSPAARPSPLMLPERRVVAFRAPRPRRLDEESSRPKTVGPSAREMTLASENAALRKQVKSLNDQVADLQARLHGFGVFADPARQFEHEIWLAYLHSTTDADRQAWPLRSYSFGPEFLGSLDLHGVERDRITACCLDVLTRRVWTNASRNPHQHRTNESGNAPAVSRSDGAMAWRCNLQTGTASARRLMWWELSDGSVELAKVAVHDDMTIR